MKQESIIFQSTRNTTVKKNNKINFLKKKRETLWLVNTENEADPDSELENKDGQMKKTGIVEGF